MPLPIAKQIRKYTKQQPLRPNTAQRDTEVIDKALFALESQGYCTGLFIWEKEAADLRSNERYCYILLASHSFFNEIDDLIGSITIYFKGEKQEVIDAFLLAEKASFSMADGTNEGELILNGSPLWSKAQYVRPAGRPVTRVGTYKRITLEVREDLLAKMDNSGTSRREYVEGLLERA